MSADEGRSDQVPASMLVYVPGPVDVGSAGAQPVPDRYGSSSLPGASLPDADVPDGARPHNPVRSAAAWVLRRLWPHTLAGRLVAGVLALVLVVVVASAMVTYVALRTYLSQRLDQQLEETAGTASVQRLLNDQPATPAFEAPQQVWLLVLGADGTPRTVQSNGGPAKMMLLRTEDAQELQNEINSPQTIRTTDGERLRVLALRRTIIIPDLQTTESAVVIVGLSTADLTGTLQHLLLLEALIAIGVVLLASGLTTLGVRTGLRPLYRVTRTARAVAAELSPEGTGLDRRVPPGDPASEVGQLAESVNTLLSAVEVQFAQRRASEDRMRQFLADASHELRTPLTSIRGYAELARLQRGARERSAGAANGDAGEQDVLSRIESEGVRMSRMVEDLLMLARSDRGVQLQYGAIEARDLVDEVVSGARAAHPERTIAGDAEAFALAADRDQLVRVLRNLVNNAAVHTAPGGQIRLTARRSARGVHGGSAVFQVIDQGPGLAPEQAAHVFERFWRADKARVRASGGTGLGLAIVASLVHAHGGTVRFESTPETGSTVTVTLPVAAPSGPEAPVGEGEQERYMPDHR